MTNGPAPVRVALIGYGLGGASFHAPLIHATDGLELAAIVTSSVERAAAARARYPRARVVAHADAIWQGRDYDAAVVSTPNRTHEPLATAALDAGLHVVVDKPLAASAADARRLVEHARRVGRVLTVYQNRRWDGDFLTLRALLEAGTLGDVHRLESRFEHWRPELKAGWRQEADPASAGGVLFDLGSHLIDQALALFGPAASVYGELRALRPGSVVDDDAFVAITHRSGVHSHLWMSLVAAGSAPRFRVLGSRGAWTKHGLDPQEARLRDGADPGEPGFGVETEDAWGLLETNEASRRIPTARGDWPRFYRLLVGSIREAAPPPVDPLDAVATLEVIEKAKLRAHSP